MSDFERIVPGICGEKRARVASIALPDELRDPEAPVPPALPLVRADPAERAGRTYELSADAAEAANVALELGQPLLVTGEPGCGKTDLAYGLALQLGRPHVWRFDTQAASVADDLFYRFDHVLRFHDASARSLQEASAYVELQALGAALTSEVTEVVLLDEIDKAPSALPNDLLRGIEEPMHFRVRELHKAVEVRQRARHLVVITSNAERELPDPFLRRCVYLHLTFPDDREVLAAIVARHLGGRADPALVTAAADAFLALRKKVGAAQADGRKPSTSELIAWTRALHARGVAPGDVAKLPLAGAVLKRPDERTVVLGANR